MSGFDPYHKWLGIPPRERPPHHYRLLGVAPFEPDPEVIAAASDQRMAFLQGMAIGPRSAESQRLLNEVAAARLCLLHAARKAAYDDRLRRASGGDRDGAGTPGSQAAAASATGASAADGVRLGLTGRRCVGAALLLVASASLVAAFTTVGGRSRPSEPEAIPASVAEDAAAESAAGSVADPAIASAPPSAVTMTSTNGSAADDGRRGPPRMKPVPNATVAEHRLLEIVPEIMPETEIDGCPQTPVRFWSNASQALAGSEFDASTGTVRWRPGEADGGRVVRIRLDAEPCRGPSRRPPGPPRSAPASPGTRP